MTRLTRPALRATAAAAFLALGMTAGVAQQAKIVGGAPMLPDQPIAANASKASNLTTLVAAADAAGLVPTLSGTQDLTVFAPTNAAFAKLPAGTVDTLLKPENKAQLTKVLTSHVVPGRLDAQELVNRVARAGGKPGAGDGVGRHDRRHPDRLEAPRHHRRVGQHRPHEHVRRLPVQWRGPRHRLGPAAQVGTGPQGTLPATAAYRGVGASGRGCMGTRASPLSCQPKPARKAASASPSRGWR